PPFPARGLTSVGGRGSPEPAPVVALRLGVLGCGHRRCSSDPPDCGLRAARPSWAASRSFHCSTVCVLAGAPAEDGVTAKAILAIPARLSRSRTWMTRPRSEEHT